MSVVFLVPPSALLDLQQGDPPLALQGDLDPPLVLQGDFEIDLPPFLGELEGEFFLDKFGVLFFERESKYNISPAEPALVSLWTMDIVLLK